MILSIGLGDEDNDETEQSKKIWIFPVPADPEAASIDIVDQLPDFSGNNISDEAIDTIEDIKRTLLKSQIYPIPVSLLIHGANRSLTEGGLLGEMFLLNANSDGINFGESEITVHEHVEKWNLVTEIVTAKTASAFEEYAKSKGLAFDENAVAAIDNYIGQNYSFVVTWINPKNEPKAVPVISYKWLQDAMYDGCKKT